ncbi:MAG TPA: cytochrome c peroxidase [Pseudomonadales bacterium]|nr:cytochrome c peroxidase [Pseudomonadales bacterium]
MNAGRLTRLVAVACACLAPTAALGEAATALPAPVEAIDAIGSGAPSRGAVDLGRRLFFDRRLSANDTLSCGMCHVPEQGFTQNELATSVGIEGAFVLRNAPSLYDVAARRSLFLDGRGTDLESQVWSPLLAPNEMGNPDAQTLLARLRAIPFYRDAFAAQFAAGLTEDTLGAALAAYERTLDSGRTAFDRWYLDGDPSALDPAARRGFTVFVRSGCGGCHVFGEDAAPFTDDDFHDTGVAFASAARHARAPARVQLAPGVFVTPTTQFESPDRRDPGRAAVTGKAEDVGRFRTPSLRNVALTAPYMHDGSLATLEAVVDYYAAGGSGDPDADPRIVPLDLTPAERADLVQFLEALTGDATAALAADARIAPIGDRDASP